VRMRRAKPPSPGSGQGARGGFDARGIRNREAVAARRRIFRVLARQQSAERLLLRVARARSRGGASLAAERRVDTRRRVEQPRPLASPGRFSAEIRIKKPDVGRRSPPSFGSHLGSGAASPSIPPPSPLPRPAPKNPAPAPSARFFNEALTSLLKAFATLPRRRGAAGGGRGPA